VDCPPSTSIKKISSGLASAHGVTAADNRSAQRAQRGLRVGMCRIVSPWTDRSLCAGSDAKPPGVKNTSVCAAVTRPPSDTGKGYHIAGTQREIVT
jgi:hypothetical protein